jgi:hypothetical protein
MESDIQKVLDEGINPEWDGMCPVVQPNNPLDVFLDPNYKEHYETSGTEYRLGSTAIR